MTPQKKYYQKNKEKIIANAKEKYQEKKEERQAYARKYYEEHKEDRKAYQKKNRQKEGYKEYAYAKRKEWYQDNKDKCRDYYLDNKEHIQKVNKKYVEENKESIKAYQKVYRFFRKNYPQSYKKLLKLRQIKPTEEEMAILDEALNIYVHNVNKKKPYNCISKTDCMGDGYHGLLVALNNFDETKGVKKRQWIIQKIQFHMIDAFRQVAGRSKKQEFYTNMTSLNNMVQLEGEEAEMINLVEDENIIDEETLIDYQYFYKKLKDFYMKKCNYKTRTLTNNQIFEIIYDIKINGWKSVEMAEWSELTESRMSQIVQRVGPIFDLCMEEIRESHEYDVS